MDFDFISNSTEQTIELGQKLGRQLKGGQVIGLIGLLGSGKTNFIKGIVAGTGAKDSRIVNSPTFVLINEYKGNLDIYHIDAYRLNSIAEFEMLGFDDFCCPCSVVIIEWADKLAPILKSIDYIRIELFHAGQNKRKILIKNAPDYTAF